MHSTAHRDWRTFVLKRRGNTAYSNTWKLLSGDPIQQNTLRKHPTHKETLVSFKPHNQCSTACIILECFILSSYCFWYLYHFSIYIMYNSTYHMYKRYNTCSPANMFLGRCDPCQYISKDIPSTNLGLASYRSVGTIYQTRCRRLISTIIKKNVVSSTAEGQSLFLYCLMWSELSSNIYLHE